MQRLNTERKSMFVILQKRKGKHQKPSVRGHRKLNNPLELSFIRV